MPTENENQSAQVSGVPPTTACSVAMTGYECNLLLFAFDDFFGTDNEGVVRDTRALDTLDNLQRLRDALFAAHDHEPNTTPHARSTTDQITLANQKGELR